MDDEKILIAKAQAGDPMAFEALIAAHQKQIFSIAYRIAGNAEDAADMTQEVLVKIFKNLHLFRGNSKFSTWLYRVATNTCLDQQQRFRRHSAHSLDRALETEDGSVLPEIADDAPTPEQALERKTLHHAVREAISKLNDDHKKVILLRDIQGLSYEEIAAILQCSDGTVKSRINRARAQLKKILLKNRELFENDSV